MCQFKVLWCREVEDSFKVDAQKWWSALINVFVGNQTA